MLVNRLKRPTCGFKACSRLQLRELIPPHTSNRFLEAEALKRMRKTMVMLKLRHKLKLKPKPKQRLRPNRELRLMPRRPTGSARPRPRRIVNAKLKRKSNSVSPWSNRSRSN